MKLSITTLFAAVGFAQAQEATAFTDPATGISFQTFSHSSGFKFGVALPATPSEDLIGYLVSNKDVFQVNGNLCRLYRLAQKLWVGVVATLERQWLERYVGISTAISMLAVNKYQVLIFAWPNGDKVVGSTRLAT